MSLKTTTATKYAEVALPLPMRQVFTYRLPHRFAEVTKVGARVIVPFGSRNLTGYVTAINDSFTPTNYFDETKLRDIIQLLDTEPFLTPEILRLTRWSADYYAASWGEMLKSSLPAGVNLRREEILSITDEGRGLLSSATGSRVSLKAQLLGLLADAEEVNAREVYHRLGIKPAQRTIRELVKLSLITSNEREREAQTKEKLVRAVRLSADAEERLQAFKPNQRHLEAVSALRTVQGEALVSELLEIPGMTRPVIETLKKHGVVEYFERQVNRDPFAATELPTLNNFTLTEDQANAFDAIARQIQTKEYGAFLLFGVTGSGKTEIYIRSIEKTLLMNKSALMMVPEIALTPVFSRRLRAVFGEQVAILHSNLSTGERFDEWRRIRSGAATVVIGTRSAIFAPLVKPGLIIVDEEHDSSYRQHESPFYNARDLAVVRANFANAVVVLGSATPSLETFHNAKQGKYSLLTLPNRVANRPMAKAELIDMRVGFKQSGSDKMFSPELLAAIEETHANGEQSIILLNRRGFSQFVLCRSCGETVRCKNCDITLTFHRRDNVLMCHYCGFRAKVPSICTFCESRYVYFVGEGTEQLEDILKTKFSEMRIARIDRDSTKKRHSLDETLRKFSEHKIDMLVGTQMLAKGHDFPNVTLVGVISVDSGLALPDFRSAERTFQLITQVAGRAGRGELAGRVLIQTFHPDHYALKHACEQSYEGFYEDEIRFRRNLGYPPFFALASFLIHHASLEIATKQAEILKRALQKVTDPKSARILGPAPAPLARLKGEHRLQLLIKANNRKTLREIIDRGFTSAPNGELDMRSINLEIDPMNLL